MSKIAIYEGYGSGPFAGYGKRRKRRSKRSGGKAAQRARFKKAAKACRGKKIGAFLSCMRAKLRK